MIREIPSDFDDTWVTGSIDGYAACHYGAAADVLDEEIDIEEIKTRMLRGWGQTHDGIAPYVLGSAGVRKGKSGEAIAHYSRRYWQLLMSDVYLEHIEAIPGSHEALDYLQDTHRGLSLATASPQELLNEVFDKVGFGRKAFKEIITAYDIKGSHIRSKPSPDMIREILRRRNTNPSEAMMIGDAVNDMIAGRSAGVVTVAVLTGQIKSPQRAFLNGVNHVIGSIAELPQLLESTPNY